MAVRTREEIVAQVTGVIGDSTSDSAISLLEDLTDTFGELENRAKGDGKDWKAEAERIDKEWREKYVKRFTTGKTDDDDDDPADPPKKEYKYENLFK